MKLVCIYIHSLFHHTWYWCSSLEVLNTETVVGQSVLKVAQSVISVWPEYHSNFTVNSGLLKMLYLSSNTQWEVKLEHRGLRCWLKLSLLEREGLQVWFSDSPPHTHTHIPYISCSKIVNGFSCPSVTAGYRCWYLVMEFNRKTIMLVAVGVNQTSQPYSGFPLSFITAEDWLNMHCVWQMAVIGLLGTFHGSTIWSISLLPSLSGKALKMNNGVGYRRWQTLCRFNFSV